MKAKARPPECDQIVADFVAMARLCIRGYLDKATKEKIHWAIMDRVMATAVPIKPKTKKRKAKAP